MDNVTKKQLKKQDKFHELTGEGIEWAGQHRRQTILTATIVIVAILLIVGGVSFYQHENVAAETAFGTAMQTYQTPLVTADQPVPPGMKTFATAQARAKAANEQFVDTAKHYGLTRAGKLAEYFAGITYAEEGQNGAAEDALKNVAGSWDSSMAALGKLALAELYQQTNQDAKAADLYNALAKGDSLTVPATEAQLALAEMYESQGKTAEARQIYATLKEKDKDSKGKPGAAAQIASAKLNPPPAGAPGAQ